MPRLHRFVIAALVLLPVTVLTSHAATLEALWELDGDYLAANDPVYDGTPKGTPTFIPGQVGQGVSFDGGTAPPLLLSDIDRVESAKLTPASDFNGGLSIVTWMRLPAMTFTGPNFICHDASNDLSTIGWCPTVLPSGQVDFFMRGAEDRRINVRTDSGAVSFGCWTHVAITWDGVTPITAGDGHIRAFVDGVEERFTETFQDTGFTGLNTSGLLPITLGACGPDSANNFGGWDGALDHVSVWKGALTPTEIANDYMATGGDVACGNGVLNCGENCDGTEDAACPGLCQPDCTCAPLTTTTTSTTTTTTTSTSTTTATTPPSTTSSTSSTLPPTTSTVTTSTTSTTLPKTALVCKEKKAKVSGKKAFDLLKAFGKNEKRPDPTNLAADISKAQSKFTKGFTGAEGKEDCLTSGDSDAIEAKVDAFVDDVVAEVAD